MDDAHAWHALRCGKAAMKNAAGGSMELIMRSAGVGLLATIVDLVVLSLLVHVGHMPPRMASVPALSLGILVQFLGNKRFAFRDSSPDWVRQGVLFLAVEAFSFGANLLLFDVAVRALAWPLIVLRLGTTNVVYFLVSLPLWARVFRQENA